MLSLYAAMYLMSNCKTRGLVDLVLDDVQTELQIREEGAEEDLALKEKDKENEGKPKRLTLMSMRKLQKMSHNVFTSKSANVIKGNIVARRFTQ